MSNPSRVLDGIGKLTFDACSIADKGRDRRILDATEIQADVATRFADRLSGAIGDGLHTEGNYTPPE